MPEAISHNLFQVGRDLILAAIAYYAFRTAREAFGPTRQVLRNGFLAALAVGALTAIMMGSPSCSDAGDGLRGGCAETNDDGYTASLEDRGGRFVYWFLLILVPAAIGATDRTKAQRRTSAEIARDWLEKKN